MIARRARAAVTLLALALGATAAGAQPADPAREPSAAELPPDSFMRPKDHRQLRLKIAERIEASTHYRTIIDGGAPKLKDAKFAGPFTYGSGQFYCASAEIEQPLSGLFKEVRTSLFKVQALGNGAQFLQPNGFGMRGQMPVPCYSAKFEPFPELEQARNKRRKAMGKDV